MLATNDNSVEIGCSQSSTSFADIIINNDNAVADGLISGFAQFVHDPKYLKEFVSVFNRQMIPEKFADAVINRRIDTQELNNIWDFPLNLTCPATVPVPWTIVDATVKAKTAAVQWEFNLMRIVDFIGRNYCRIVLPEVDTTGVMDEAVRNNTALRMADKRHMYLGAWHRDLIPRIIKEVEFYPRSNSHKLFTYSGYDIFVHNMLFGNAMKKLNDLMAGEDAFEIVYDPYAVHGSALGLASYKGVDDGTSIYNLQSAGPASPNINVASAGTGVLVSGFNNKFIYDSFMDGKEFAQVYRRGVWYEAPMFKNYGCRHSIHSRRFVHAAKVITFPLDILPFSYSIASALPSAAIAGDCGFISIKLHPDWFDRAFYLTRLADIPLLHPIVNHTHYDVGNVVYVPQLEKQINDGTISATEPLNLTRVTGNDWIRGWVNPLSIGRFGDYTFQVKLRVPTDDEGNVQEGATATVNPSDYLHQGTISNTGNIINGYPANVMEGIVYSVNQPVDITGAQLTGNLLQNGLPGYGAGTTSLPAGPGFNWGRVEKTFAGNVVGGTINTSTTNDYSDVESMDDYLGMFDVNIKRPSQVDTSFYASFESNIGLKLLQVGYQTLPCIREFLSKLPNIYMTTEWSTLDVDINTTQFDINNDLYIQGILFWFLPQDLNGVDSMRLYPHQLINHEMPVIPGIRLTNEQAQGTTIYTWDMMNELTPHILGCEQPLLENIGLVAFTSKLAANSMPYAYYDSNIAGYLKCTILPPSESSTAVAQQTGTVVNLKAGKLKVISFGTNGVALVNLNLFRLIF